MPDERFELEWSLPQELELMTHVALIDQEYEGRYVNISCPSGKHHRPVSISSRFELLRFAMLPPDWPFFV
jgi:hypothetical protein